ncbi:MAG: carbon storage regulator [Planctomycetia bacterium]|nr:carbon storage regulator [Planctomycetia bacterium]
MLILSRKLHESIRIGDDITVTIVRLGRGRVQVGIDAPDDVRIRREEIPAELDMFASLSDLTSLGVHGGSSLYERGSAALAVGS